MSFTDNVLFDPKIIVSLQSETIHWTKLHVGIYIITTGSQGGTKM